MVKEDDLKLFINNIKNKEVNLYFSDNGTFIILDVEETKNNIHFYLIHKRNYLKNKDAPIDIKTISKNLINNIKNTKEGYTVYLMYGKNMRGLYMVYFLKDSINFENPFIKKSLEIRKEKFKKKRGNTY